MNKKEIEIIDWEFEKLLRNIVAAYLKLRKFNRFSTCLDTHGEVKEIYDIKIKRRGEDDRGEWIGNTDLDNTCKCSKCRMTFDTDRLKMVMCDGKYELPPCCPNCGSDMRGKEE